MDVVWPGVQGLCSSSIPTAEDQDPPGCCPGGCGCSRGSLCGKCPGEAARLCWCSGSGRSSPGHR